jgi:HTH-type transcriptional regulator / antitoxin HipB
MRAANGAKVGCGRERRYGRERRAARLGRATGNGRASGSCFTSRMTRTRLQLEADRHAREGRRSLAADLRHLREDAGISQAALGRVAGVDRSVVSRAEAGRIAPTLETYQRLASALGADLAVRLYPNTGPAIRDRHQAAMLEALLAMLHPRWRAFTELAVRRPGRGWIDAALHDPEARVLVATELQSELRRLEQLIRWSAEKAASLPSWDGWTHLGEAPHVERLLVVRRTRGTRAVASELERQLRVAYPAHPQDALAALHGTAPWPGPAMVWATADGARTRLAPYR